MRLGVLDIGSNTGHLLVVDVHGGAAPMPAYSHQEPLRLAEHLDAAGAVTESGVAALTKFVASSIEVAEDKGCSEMLGFATSAVRDASNCDEVLEHVKAEGARVVDEHPRTGSRGTTVAFLHPKTSQGTLIELVEE